MAPIAITPPAVTVKDLPMPTESANKRRKIICFSDFDGTIFMQDTGHVLFDNFGCGSKKRQVLDEQIKTGERSFKDVSEEMWGSLNVPFENGFDIMEESLDMDQDFRTFHAFCLENSIPFNVISAGLKPVLRKVLDAFLGEEQSRHIDIVANDVDITEDGSEWRPIWRHQHTDLGHDKALSIREARAVAVAEADLAGEDGTIPLIVFIGDGVSDLPAARQADVLFARRGLRLEEYCVDNKIAYVPFDTFADIQRELVALVREDEAKTGGKGMPAGFNPRANLWRRVSSKATVPRFVVMTPSKEERMFLWPEVFTELKTPALDVTKQLGMVGEETPIAVPAA